MLGSDLVSILQRAGYHVTAAGREHGDITDEAAMTALMKFTTPDLVVNCAAMTAVDACEDQIEKAMLVNGHGAGTVASAAAAVAAPIIHISTDYVFNGQSTTPYSEDDPMDPLGIYGKSKALGEKLVSELNPAHYILRTSWLYGRNGRNFVDTMLKLSTELDSIQVVSDQIGSPTFTVPLAHAILELIDYHFFNHSLYFGIYHASGNDQCSWYDFARAIFSISENSSIEVIPIDSEQVKALFQYKAPRPCFSVLNNSKLHKVFGISLPHWQTSLKDYLNS